MAREFTAIAKPKRGVGKNCMHCGRSATTKATRHVLGMRRLVQYCDEHAALIIYKKEVAG